MISAISAMSSPVVQSPSTRPVCPSASSGVFRISCTASSSDQFGEGRAVDVFVDVQHHAVHVFERVGLFEPVFVFQQVLPHAEHVAVGIQRRAVRHCLPVRKFVAAGERARVRFVRDGNFIAASDQPHA